MITEALDLATELASRPGFDDLHDPDKSTGLIEAYHDPVGFPTQGYGRLLSRVKWEDLSKYPAISPDTAKAWLKADIQRAAKSAHRLIKVQLTAPQWAAIYDFCFNCGGGNLQGSVLLARINREEFDGVPSQLMRFVYASKVKLNGLVRRRKAEVQMWEEGI